MKIGNKRRTYLADALAKIAEYIVSLIILGQLVKEGQINIKILVFAGLGFAISLVIGTILTPTE